MSHRKPINILVVDDQPAKLLSLQAILSDLGENVIAATSADDALKQLLANEIAVVLMDVCMPRMDGFELAELIRDHPRFKRTAIIFISAVHLTDDDRLRGYRAGAVDYIPVPIIPEVLRAKVTVFAELYRKTDELRQLNEELERRVTERTADLHATAARQRESEQRYRQLFHSLPAAVCTCDAQGRITLYNQAAAELWGREPEIGSDAWCGSWRMYRPDGQPLPLEGCPTAISLREGRPVRDVEIIIERPDGARRNVMPYPDPIFDDAGRVVGVINMLMDITDRKQVDEMRSHLAAIVDSSDDAIISKTLDGIVTTWNGGAERLFGYRPGEIIGRSIATLIPPDRMEEERQLLHRLRGGERVAHFETVRLAKDGRPIDLSVSVSPVLDSAGRVIGVSNVSHDITERKRVMAELAATKDDLSLQVTALTRLHGLAMQVDGEQRLAESLNSVLATLMSVHEADFGLVSLYDESAGLLKVETSVGFDEAALASVAPVEPGPFAGACGCAFDTKARTIVEDVETDERFDAFRQAARSAGFRAVHSTPIMNRAGKALGVLSVHFKASRRPTRLDMQLADLCARHAADVIEAAWSLQAVRASEERFRLMADSAPTLIWIADTGMRRIWFNRPWLDFTGRELESQTGEGWVQGVHPDDARRCAAIQAEAFAARREFRMEYRLRRHDGESRWLMDHGIPLYTGHQEFSGYIGSCVDVTDQVLARQALEEHQTILEGAVRARTAELEASNQRLRMAERMASIGTLSAGLGHDMGNLLLPIRVRLESLAKAALPRDLQEHVEAIRTSSDYLQRLSNGLRLLAIDPHHRGVSEESTPIASWWSDAEPILKNALPRGMALKSRIDETDCRAAISRAALTQVVFNLVQNAGDAMRGKECGLVTISARREGDMVRLDIADNGSGMTEEVKQRCMQPFFTTKTRAISTGMGLVLVYGLVHEAGGTVSVETVLGEGTAFTIRLPVSVESVPDRSAAAERRPLAFVQLADVRLRAFVASELSSLSCDTTTDMARSSAADVAVVERMNGSLRLSHDTPVLLLGDGEDGDRERASIVLEVHAKPAAIRAALRRLAAGGPGLRRSEMCLESREE